MHKMTLKAGIQELGTEKGGLYEFISRIVFSEEGTDRNFLRHANFDSQAGALLRLSPPLTTGLLETLTAKLVDCERRDRV